jgi:hypothetical protein
MTEIDADVCHSPEIAMIMDPHVQQNPWYLHQGISVPKDWRFSSSHIGLQILQRTGMESAGGKVKSSVVGEMFLNGHFCSYTHKYIHTHIYITIYIYIYIHTHTHIPSSQTTSGPRRTWGQIEYKHFYVRSNQHLCYS